MYRRLPVALAALLVASSSVLLPQDHPKTATATVASPSADYSKESIIYDKIATAYSFQADGTGEKTLTVEERVQSDNGVRQAGLLSFDYASGNEHLDIVYLRVRKPDGTVIDTPSSDEQDLPTDVTREAPFYSDLREVQIPVKSLSAGDRLEYQIRWTTQKPTAPGEFWGALNFYSDNVVLQETVEISYPENKYALVLSPNCKPDITDENGRHVYRWKSSQLKPTADLDKKVTPDPDAMPAIAWTTFRNWQEVGEWFGGLAHDRAAVTPEIQAKAQQLIAGKATDDQKIEAIYDYVSTQVRYIGVAFGVGRYQPHPAETVLENQYGDCKDKHTLLAALLKAAGYDAWPALIGSGQKLHEEIPSPAQFDHVITVVSLHNSILWLDSTPEITPYRMLVAPLRDKMALVIPTNGQPELMRTPADGPFPFSDTYTVTGKLDDQGTVLAHFDLEMRGDNEAAFRSIFHAIPRAQWEQVVQNISQGMGFAGTVSNLDVSSPERTDQPFHYAYDYERKEYADWADRRILALGIGVSLPAIGDDAPTKPIEFGSLHVESQHGVLELPSDYKADLPHSVKYTTPFAVYEADYKLDGNKLITDRKLQILDRSIPIEKADEFRKFSKNVTEDEGQYIQLTSAKGESADSVAPNPQARQLMASAEVAMEQQDFQGARSDLEHAEQLSPRELNLWAAYAVLESRQKHGDEAVTDLQKEIQYHPDNVAAYRMLYPSQIALKHNDQAEQTLRGLLKIIPGDPSTETVLGEILVDEKHYEEAASLLEAARKASPGNGELSVQTGSAEILAGNRDAGAATLRGVLDGSTDPLILNDAAYALADASLELPLAEASSKKALETLDKQTAQVNLGNLSQDDLAHMQLLAATWDTMGWIYFREGNLPLAEAYVLPAWKVTQRTEVADHLRQIYVKEGRQHDADAIAKENLQNERTRTLPKLWKKGSADFYLLLSADKVEDVQFVTGDDFMRAALPVLRKQDFSGQVPKGSSARLLRRGILYCSEVAGCQFVLIPPTEVKLN